MSTTNWNVSPQKSEHSLTELRTFAHRPWGIPALIVQLGIKQHLEYAIPFGKLTVCY